MSVVTGVAVSTAVLVGLAPLASSRPRRVEPLGPRPWRSLLIRIDALVQRRRPIDRSVRPAAVADWADHLARSLRHGSTLHAALTTVHPADAALAGHCEPLRHWLARGATVVDACDEWSDRLASLRDPRAELLATTAAVVAAVAMLGGTAAEPLDRLAATMRQHVSDDLEREAQSAQAQMSARVLTVVPLAVLALLLLTDADVRTVLTRPAGITVVAVGLTVNAAGAAWMRSIATGGRRRSSANRPPVTAS